MKRKKQTTPFSSRSRGLLHLIVLDSQVKTVTQVYYDMQRERQDCKTMDFNLDKNHLRLIQLLLIIILRMQMD